MNIKDYVKVTNVQENTPSTGRYRVTTEGQVSSIYLQQSISDPDKKFSYNINEIGWYSYKIVVKQQEQDYYNVYLPGIVKRLSISRSSRYWYTVFSWYSYGIIYFKCCFI